MKGIYIPQIDGKDIRLSNNQYTLLTKDGEPNLKRYKATFDYSLDLLKLREFYGKAYRNNRFYFCKGDKKYSPYIINVTFKYSVKEYNKNCGNIHIKAWHSLDEVELDECIYEDGDELIAFQTGQRVSNPRQFEDNYVYYDDKTGCYAEGTSNRTIEKVSDIREALYKDGFECDGIHYVRWKRSAGSARVGKCLFIDEQLLRYMRKWETIVPSRFSPITSIDLAAYESYVSLTSSSILDTLQISANNILVVDDYESVFTDDVAVVEDDNTKLVSRYGISEIKNNIFDGQSIIDKSLMGKYSDKGMILLRNRFFKSCCFNANVQQWFADNGVTDVSQLNGFTFADKIEDVKLITTPSSIKWVKFGTISEWLTLLDETFGVVKHEKPTHFLDGYLVQTHYQLINSIQMTKREIEELLEPTFDFMTLVKKTPSVLMHWIKFNIEEEVAITPVLSKTDVIYKMLSINKDFCNTKYYYDFQSDFLKAFTSSLKSGHVFVEGNYSTICGNPIEMLLHTIGKFDGTSIIGKDKIYSTRFDFGKKILASRSPHITFSNVILKMNVRNELIEKYMNPTNEIIYINSINENILQQAAGCDFDSDQVLITDNKVLISATERNYGKFPVAISNVHNVKHLRLHNAENLAKLDHATCKNYIGEIVNLSQELNSAVWNILSNGGTEDDVKDIYLDICKLSIMSGIEIDRAKRLVPVDDERELFEIRNKYTQRIDEKIVKPNFFAHIARKKGYYDPSRKIYTKYETPMDYLQSSVNAYRLIRSDKKNKNQFMPFADLINCEGFNYTQVNYRQIAKIFELIDISNNEISSIYSNEFMSSGEKYALSGKVREDLRQHIGNIKLKKDTAIALLKSIERVEKRRYKRLTFYSLFGHPNKYFYKLLLENRNPHPPLMESDDGDITIFGHKYCKNDTKNADSVIQN